MKCKICKCKTTYDDSIGRDCFIVCNKCADKLNEELDFLAPIDIFAVILSIGFMKEKNKKTLDKQ